MSPLVVALVGLPVASALAALLFDGRARTLCFALACLGAATGWAVARAGLVEGTMAGTVVSVAAQAPIGVVLGAARPPRERAAFLASIAMVLLALAPVGSTITALALAASTALVLVLARAGGVARGAQLRFALVAGGGVAAFGAAQLVQASAPSAVTASWSLLFVAAATLGALVPFHVGVGALLDGRRPLLALAVGASFLRLGPMVLVRWALPVLPEATRWAAPVVLGWAVVAGVFAALGSVARTPSSHLGTMAFATASTFAAAMALDAQGLAAVALHGAGSGLALAFALGYGEHGRLGRALIASGAGVSGVLTLTAITARSPVLAVVHALALAVVVLVPRTSADPRSRAQRVLAGITAALLVGLTANAVDRVAPAARALGERFERTGGEIPGS